jgi:hypothetical protein
MKRELGINIIYVQFVEVQRAVFVNLFCEGTPKIISPGLRKTYT